MNKDISPPQWLCTGKSVRGASHDRSGLPNQDAIAWYPESRVGAPLILAVSDGHGSAKSFRSDRGSQFAVKTAIEVIQEFLFAPSGDLNTSIVKNMEDLVKRLLPTKITDRWKDTVRADLQEHPLTDREQDLNNIDNPFLAYGATLLVVTVTESFIIYLQLGDGDILRVDEDGKTTKPLAKNPDLIGNETTSLCMDKSWNQFQIKVETQNTYTPKPSLILLSTDGYSNSYASDLEFFKIGQDYLQEIREIGIESVEQQLGTLLQEISSGGSGDDITVGIVRRLEQDDRDNLDIQQAVPNETQDNGGDLMEVDNKRRPGKTVRDSRGLNLKPIAMAALFLAIASTCFSGYLFWKLGEVETSLAKIEINNQEHQKKVANLEQKVTQLELK